MERKLKTSLPDTRSIDTNDEYALEFWAGEFNVTLTKLKAAVVAAGTNAPDVKRCAKPNINKQLSY